MKKVGETHSKRWMYHRRHYEDIICIYMHMYVSNNSASYAEQFFSPVAVLTRGDEGDESVEMNQ